MAHNRSDVLSIAVGSGKIGFVFISRGKVCDQGLSAKAASSPEAAAEKALEWIEFYQPQEIVVEALTPQTRKSGQTIQNIHAIDQMAHNIGLPVRGVERIQNHANKYDEIDALALQYPELEGWKPKRRQPWESEPKTTAIWEALALINQDKS